MANFIQFEHDWLEIIINDQTKEIFASQGAIARICKIANSTLSYRISISNIAPIKIKMQTISGMQEVCLYDLDFILSCLARYNHNRLIKIILILKEQFNLDIEMPKIAKKSQRVPNTSKNGYIYLFGNEHVLKLGYTANVINRLKTLQRWDGELEIIAKVKGTQPQEMNLHSLLHQTGKYFGCEWYPAYRKHEILNLMGANLTMTRSHSL